MGGCETCEEDIYYCEKGKEWLMRVSTPYWDSYNGDFGDIEIQINWCPSCGKCYKILDTEEEKC